MAWRETLENGMIHRTVESDVDAKRFAQFSTEVNNRMEGLTCECLLHHFPGSVGENYQIIEDPETGEIVSTACVIPWRVNFNGITMSSLMPEMIATRPSYRKRGLVRIQMDRLARAMVERQMDLAILWGIPYYYRQFGYSYAIEGSVVELLHPGRVPTAFGDGRTLRLRNAEISDIPTLEELYRAHSSRLEIFVERDADHWTYMIRDAKLIVRLAERAADGTPVGYVVCSNESSTGNLYILENSIPGHEDAQEVLSILAGECRGELAVRWPESSTLARIAADLGSTRVRSTQWLFMMPNIPAFLTKLLPLFSARLSESAYAKSSVDLVVNLFREAFLFRVHNGRVERVESIGFRDASMGAEGGDLLIPRDAFVRLVMGHNDLSELRDPWPDIVVKPESRHLIEVLFPKLTGYLYTPYHYSNGEFYG